MKGSRTARIGATRIHIPKEDKEGILNDFQIVLDSSILTEGKYCRDLEKRLRDYLGSKFVITTNSGTAALEAVIRAAGLNGEIIVTTETFSATIYSILRSGCKPVLADVGRDMCILPDEVRRRITPKTCAVIVVHIGGFVSDSLPEIHEICESKGFTLLEDSAQSMGSKYRGRFAGTFGKGAGFSLFPTKVMGSAEGGFVTTDDGQLADRARLMKDQGKSVGNLCTIQGYNWRMNEFQAIIALSQLARLEQFISARGKIAKEYDDFMNSERLQGKLTLFPRSSRCRPNWYKYIAYLKGPERKLVKGRLEKMNVNLSGEVYEVPIHTQPAFAELGYRHGDFPSAEELCSKHICFPLMPNLSDLQVQYFLDCLEEVFR